MTGVPVHEALFWRSDAPVNTSGEVDFGSIAQGLALTEHRIEPRGRCDPRRQLSADDPSDPRRRFVRNRYTRAQHAVVVSEAVDSLAGLQVESRRVLATHVCLAAVQDEQLGPGSDTGGRKKIGWRTMELEALAEAMAHNDWWKGSAEPVPGAAAVDGLLAQLGGLGEGERKKLALHALLSETVPAGLGTAVAEAALERAGLQSRVPAVWVRILRLIRRMADAAVRRDVPGTGPVGKDSFPALERPIGPMDPAAAARLWLARYEALTAP